MSKTFQEVTNKLMVICLIEIIYFHREICLLKLITRCGLIALTKPQSDTLHLTQVLVLNENEYIGISG